VGIDSNRESPLEADSRMVIMRQSCKEAEAALAARWRAWCVAPV